MVNATYETKLLFLDKSVENYKYTYECKVMNSRGNDFIRVTPQGEKIIVYYSNGILCKFIIITLALVVENKILSVGHNDSITCTSIVVADVIEWLNSNGETIISAANTTELRMTFAPVNTSINNRQYTCRAIKNGSVETSADLSVSGKILLKVINTML